MSLETEERLGIDGKEAYQRLEIEPNGAGLNVVDLDGTLWDGNILWPLALKQVADDILHPNYLVDLYRKMQRFNDRLSLREYEILVLQILQVQARYLAGKRESRVVNHAADFIDREVELFEYVPEMFELSRKAGRHTWFATTQTDLVAAAAMKKWEEYGVRGYSASLLEMTDDPDPAYTGKVLRVLHGWDKGKIAQRLVNGIDTSIARIGGYGKQRSFAMGNARADLNMGPHVGDFVLVKGDPNTTRLARRKGYHTPSACEIIPTLQDIFHRQSSLPLHQNPSMAELPHS